MRRVFPMTLVWCLLASCALHTPPPAESPHIADVIPSCAFFGLTVWWMARCYNASLPMSTVHRQLPKFVRRGIRDGVLETDRFSVFWYQEWFAALAQILYAQGLEVSPEGLRQVVEHTCFAYWDTGVLWGTPPHRNDEFFHWINQGATGRQGQRW